MPETKYQKYMQWIYNNPIFALVILVATITLSVLLWTGKLLDAYHYVRNHKAFARYSLTVSTNDSDLISDGIIKIYQTSNNRLIITESFDNSVIVRGLKKGTYEVHALLDNRIVDSHSAQLDKNLELEINNPKILIDTVVFTRDIDLLEKGKVYIYPLENTEAPIRILDFKKDGNYQKISLRKGKYRVEAKIDKDIFYEINEVDVKRNEENEEVDNDNRFEISIPDPTLKMTVNTIHEPLQKQGYVELESRESGFRKELYFKDKNSYNIRKDNYNAVVYITIGFRPQKVFYKLLTVKDKEEHTENFNDMFTIEGQILKSGSGDIKIPHRYKEVVIQAGQVQKTGTTNIYGKYSIKGLPMVEEYVVKAFINPNTEPCEGKIRNNEWSNRIITYNMAFCE